MKRLSAVLVLVLLLTGCSSAEVSEPETDATPSPAETSASHETEASPCAAVAQSTIEAINVDIAGIEAINVGIAGIEPANIITSAVCRFPSQLSGTRSN